MPASNQIFTGHVLFLTLNQQHQSTEGKRTTTALHIIEVKLSHTSTGADHCWRDWAVVWWRHFDQSDGKHLPPSDLPQPQPVSVTSINWLRFYEIDNYNFKNCSYVYAHITVYNSSYTTQHRTFLVIFPQFPDNHGQISNQISHPNEKSVQKSI